MNEIYLIKNKNNNGILDEKDILFLKNLNLSYDSYIISNEDLKKLKNLEELYLFNYSVINDDCLKHLTNLKKLSLTFDSVISDNGIKDLINLKELNIWPSDKITDQSFINLKKLKIISLYRNKTITDDAIKNIDTLKSLDLSFNEKITNEGIKNLKNLKNLSLRGNENITDKGLNKLTNLKSLDLTLNEKITDKGIKNLINLEELILDSNNIITNEGIKKLKNLRKLSLNKNYNISDEGIKNLVNLKSLILNDSGDITNNGLKKLVNIDINNLEGYDLFNEKTNSFKLDIKNTINNPKALEKFIREKLGQRNFNLEESRQVNHLRFDFDAQDNIESILKNSKIIELFEGLFFKEKILIHSWKGTIVALIINKLDFEKYKNRYFDSEIIRNVVFDECIDDEELPYLNIINYSGCGTVEIIEDLILKLNIY